MSDTSTNAIARAVTLDHDLKLEDGTVVHPAGTRIVVRKPMAGEFRGLTIMAVSQLDYGALETLLPRITQPRLDKIHVASLDPADLMQLGGEVMDFLLPTAARPASLEA
jgi:hypothetical protein